MYDLAPGFDPNPPIPEAGDLRDPVEFMAEWILESLRREPGKWGFGKIYTGTVCGGFYVPNDTVLVRGDVSVKLGWFFPFVPCAVVNETVGLPIWAARAIRRERKNLLRLQAHKKARKDMALALKALADAHADPAI